MTDNELRAWCNGNEVVAAHSADEARTVLHHALGGGPEWDAEDVDGSGWRPLPPGDEAKSDGAQTAGTVASVLAESDEPRHLWSIA